MSNSMADSIQAPIADWSTNYLSTEYCVLRTESIGHFAIPSYEGATCEAPAFAAVASWEAVR